MLDHLLTFLRTRAPSEAEISLLQPADPFLETAGEDLRRRIFITENSTGDIKCLRPEFTIPICLHHMDNVDSVKSGADRYAYGGTVFRQDRVGANEFQQVGLEDLGNTDGASADAASIADMIEALKLCGLADLEVVLGDQRLFGVVVDKLELPTPIAARLVRNFGSPKQLEHLIGELENNRVADHDIGNEDQLAMSGQRDALIDLISSKMQSAGLSPKAGRSPQDIAERMIAKVTEGHFRLSKERASLLRAFLSIKTPLDEAPTKLTEIGKQAGFEFDEALGEFERRNAALLGLGVNLQDLTYQASLGRKLDYYTGVLFEARKSGFAHSIAGGGRYDKLCSLLGNPQAVPAIGFSISLDRVREAGGQL